MPVPAASMLVTPTPSEPPTSVSRATVAGASAAEGEVVADHDVAGADARSHHVRDERCRLARREGAVEARDVEKPRPRERRDGGP